MNAAHLIDDTLIARDICQPGETISALIRPAADYLNPSGLQISASPPHGKLAALEDRKDQAVKESKDAFSSILLEIKAEMSGEVKRMKEELKDANSKQAGLETRMAHLEKSENTQKRQTGEMEKKFTDDLTELERRHAALNGRHDATLLELNGLKQQHAALKVQHDTARLELNGLKQHLLDLQATSEDTVDWISGKVSFQFKLADHH